MSKADDGCWSYSAGRPPYTVRVFERKDRTNLYSAVWDPEKGEVKRSLGHADREKAMDYADDLAPKLRDGTERVVSDDSTVGNIFKLYRAHRVPDKSERVQKGDDRRLKRWKRYLGADFDLSRLSRREWDTFKRKRASGALDAKGREVPNEDDRREVGARTVEKDLRFLRSVCRWAMDWRGGEGHALLDRDPTRGLEIPSEKNPARPILTHDRLEKLREHAPKLTMRVEWSGKRETVETPFPEILELLAGTGRRVGAVRKLKVDDLDLDRTPNTPHGAIVWPSDTDKMDREWRCPISERVRETLESALEKRRRQGRVGAGYLFSSPEDASEPVPYRTLRGWLRETERLAELEPQKGGNFHPFRRLWASARKDLPDVDVARAGGWNSLEALQQAYQQPDDETMLRVVEHEAELREVR